MTIYVRLFYHTIESRQNFAGNALGARLWMRQGVLGSREPLGRVNLMQGLRDHSAVPKDRKVLSRTGAVSNGVSGGKR
jgi:hypothetical protein